MPLAGCPLPGLHGSWGAQDTLPACPPARLSRELGARRCRLRLQPPRPAYTAAGEPRKMPLAASAPRPAFTAAGWAAQDALRFWKTEFSKKMPAEKWEKQYAYGVRYNYGKEGKRADYTPYSCMKIIMSTPGEGDAHGCPYRNLKEDNLRAALRSMNLNNKAMDEVLDKVRNQHYQLACQSTFEGTHNCSCDVGINHPNQYFKESRKVLVGDPAAVEPNTPADTTRSPQTFATPQNATGGFATPNAVAPMPMQPLTSV
ncbi:hypothetical protein CYMTET_38547 [Cymbomonas tetramitiformis]|uniref:DNA primase large subunit C-terminal domain-containing protein n=1 Tax=Cymbomonas tetramitiformis TaxID=36881 RepID=A0AAE0F5K1_9CHLO|nr:hypothetical protein CYMTET_38547 [Cymbomonas tetramitiformis]